MNLVLEIKETAVKGHAYHRLLVPKRVSDRLGTQAGDIWHIDIQRVMRQGRLLMGDPDSAEETEHV